MSRCLKSKLNEKLYQWNMIFKCWFKDIWVEIKIKVRPYMANDLFTQIKEISQ